MKDLPYEFTANTARETAQAARIESSEYMQNKLKTTLWIIREAAEQGETCCIVLETDLTLVKMLVDLGYKAEVTRHGSFGPVTRVNW